MKKYYKESDTSFSINSSSELKRKNNTITPNGSVIKTFIQPVLTSDVTMGGDSFAVKANSHYGASYDYQMFDGKSTHFTANTTNLAVDMYNPIPLLIISISYDLASSHSEAGRNSGIPESVVLYGSNTGEFAGEEEQLAANEEFIETGQDTITFNVPDNQKAFKYHRLYWEKTTCWFKWFDAVYWHTVYAPRIKEIRLTAYEVESNNDEYAKSLNIKQHVLTDYKGNFVKIPAQHFDITTLENGIYDLFSNIETKKVEALTVKSESKKDNQVKIGSVKLVSSKLIADLINEEFNAVKKEHQYYFGKYKCGYNGRKTYMPVLPEFLYYKNTNLGAKEADKSDYDFFVVRPSFNVQDGGVMCFNKEYKNGVKS